MNHGLGCKRSHPAKLAARAHAVSIPAIAAAVSTATPPASASLAASRCQREDQGQTSTCYAHAPSAGIYTTCQHAGAPLGFVPSPEEISSCTHGIERALVTPAGQQLPDFTDAGAELADVVTALAHFGVSPIKAPTPDGRFSDIWGPDDAPNPDVNAEPDVAAIEVARTHLVVGPYGISPGDGATCAAAIAAGFPLYIGFFADSGFEAWKKGDAPYGKPNESDPNGGGHAVLIDGYTTNDDGSRTWTLVNSWGNGWGDDGTCLVSDAFMQAVWECWVLDVSVKAGAS